MIALFAAFLAVASAAPHDYGFSFDSNNALSESFADGIFDTSRFWTDLANEMHRMDDMLQEFSKHFPSTVATAEVVGNEYVVTVTLTGFDEKDIVVKAREGVLMIQAVHQDESGNQKTYMDLRTLPSNINVSGSWTYDKDVLKITFPLIKKEGEETTEEKTETVDENRSREEVDKTDETSEKDADVGLEKHDLNKDDDRETLTNEISSSNAVEATTYAVDLKDEVEFVPVKY